MAKQGRPRVRGGGRKASVSTKKRMKYSNRQKLDVVNHFRACNDAQQTITHFFPAYSANARLTMSKSVYLWRQQRATVEKRCETAATAAKKYNHTCAIATTLSEYAEQEILDWVNMLRSEGVPVSNVMLREKARAVAAERGVSPFEGLWSWRKAFRKTQAQHSREDASRAGSSARSSEERASLAKKCSA